MKPLLEWAPHVVADLHEMGGESTYYFPPTAEPPNPHMTKIQAGWLEAFGRANATRFDERGFAYFNREVFDAFYPGYGVSWPIAQGAIGMTFEMASARGLAYRRQDEATLTYLDGAVRHFTSAITTAATASRNREKMLRDYLEFRRNAGAGTTKAYLLPIGYDAGQTLRLVRTLVDYFFFSNLLGLMSGLSLYLLIFHSSIICPFEPLTMWCGSQTLFTCL